MDETDTLLVVGAGNAGSELAVSARQNGWPDAIVLIGDETHLPYHRPPLSKTYLAGKADAESLSMRPATVYEKAAVTVRLGTRVEAIDLHGDRLLAADAVGRAAEFMVAKRLIAAAGRVDPTQLADESMPLKSLLPAPSRITSGLSQG